MNKSWFKQCMVKMLAIGIVVQIAVGWKVGSNDGEDVGNSVSPIGIIVEITDE